MLQGVEELSIISADFVLEIAFSRLSIPFPLSFAPVSFGGFPNSTSLFHSIFPLPLIHLPIVPGEHSKSISDSVNEVASVHSVNVALITLYFNIFVIFTLKDFLFCHGNPFSMLGLIGIGFAKVDTLLLPNDVKIRPFYNLHHLELWIHGLIIFEVLLILGLLWYSEEAV